MLPFMDRKKIVSTISSRRGKTPDIAMNTEIEAPDSEMDPGLKNAAEDVLRAIETKSPMDLAKALRMVYEACGSYSDED